LRWEHNINFMRRKVPSRRRRPQRFIGRGGEPGISKGFRKVGKKNPKAGGSIKESLEKPIPTVQRGLIDWKNEKEKGKKKGN